MSKNIVDAEKPSSKGPDEIQHLKIDVYIGVFFDGTNNNMMQAMIGQKFRRDKVFKSHADKLKKLGYKNANDVIAKPRSHWETEQNDVFAKSDLDRLYGGTSLTYSYDLEQEIATNNSKYSYSSVEVDNADNPINFHLGSQYKKKISNIANLTDKKSFLPDIAISGSFSQGSTYTNPCILWSIYSTGEENDPQDDKHKIYHHRIYVEGSGSDSTVTAAANVDGAIDNIIGLGFGVGPTGVSAKCRKMVQQVNNIYGMYHRPEVAEICMHFDVFGFSRGATTARIFSYIVDPNNEGKVSSNDYLLFTGKAKPFLPLKENDASSLLTKKEVRMLGIYDTVASIGILRDPLNMAVSDAINIKDNVEFSKYGKSQYHDRNVDDFGLYATTNAKDVIHFCALDENRINFSITDIESSILSGNGTEIFLPGCHTDIGGGASLGQDGLKVINKEASNFSEVFGSLLQKVQGAKNLAEQAKKTINDAKATASGIKSIVSGINRIISGDMISGFVKTMDGVTSSYEGLRQTVSDAHSSVQTLKDTLMDVEVEAVGYGDGTRILSNPSEGLDDFAKKGILEHLSDITGSGKLKNAVKQKNMLIKGGNELVDSTINAYNAAKGVFDNLKSEIKGDSIDEKIDGTLDKADQAINGFITVLQEISSATSSVSTIVNAIKGIAKGKDSTDTGVVSRIKKITDISDRIIHECERIKNDISLSKDILETLCLFKEELTKKYEVGDQQVLKTNIDNVNDALDGIAKSLVNCDSTISGVQTMLQGLESLQGHVNAIEGTHNLVHGIKKTYEGTRDAIELISQTSTGIWNNIEILYKNTLNGFISPTTGSGQGTGQDLYNNLTSLASGLDGIDKSYDSLNWNINFAHEKLKEISSYDFGSIKGIENSLSSVSTAIQSTLMALDNVKSMADSAKTASSNLLRFGKNLKTASNRTNLFNGHIVSAKKSFSEFFSPATDFGNDIVSNLSSNLTNMASGLTGTLSNFDKTQTNVNAIGVGLGNLSSCNLHSVNGIMNAFSDVSSIITNSLNSLNDFKSMLESAKQTTTNALGLGVNTVSAVTKGYSIIKNSIDTLIHPSSFLEDYLTPATGSSNSVIENITNNIKNALIGIENIKSGYAKTLSNAATAVLKVKGLKKANLHSIQGIANALTDSASAIDSSINAFQTLPSILDNIKQTSTNIIGLSNNLQRAFTKENGHFVIIKECSEFINNKYDEIKTTFIQAKETAAMLKDLITGKTPILPKFEKKPLCFYNYYPCSEIKNPTGAHGLLPVGIDSLKALGWVDDNVVIENDQTRVTGRATKESLAKGDTVIIEGTKAFGIKRINNIGIYKYVYPGYSNITLKLMIDWCVKKSSTIFKPLNEMRYAIPSDLNAFYSQIKQSCLYSKGRFFCVPKYEDTYRKVRLKYLHFSMNQQLLSAADDILVNGPSVTMMGEKYVIIRRIYIGKKGSPTAGTDESHSGQLIYLYDYNGSKGVLKEFNFSITNAIV